MGKYRINKLFIRSKKKEKKRKMNKMKIEFTYGQKFS